MGREIVWFRRDARLEDNPAWIAGSKADEVVPLFVIDPRLFNVVSDRRRIFLLGGLRRLDEALAEKGGRLRVEIGDPKEVLPLLGPHRIHINREVTPFGMARDREIATFADLQTHEGTYVQPPGTVLTKSGSTYKVFTPFPPGHGPSFLYLRPNRPPTPPSRRILVRGFQRAITRLQESLLPEHGSNGSQSWSTFTTP